jgi:ornithine racemase
MTELRVDTGAVRSNAEAVSTMLRRRGLELVGVTKGCLGEPRVAKAMLEGGASALADTRDPNLRRLRDALPGVELHRIHLPSLAESFEPGDITYVSSWAGAEAVAALAASQAPRRVMVQVETGDEREGTPLELLADLSSAIAADPRLDLVGISTNYACFRGEPGGIRESVAAIARAAVALRAAGLVTPRVSGGNSSVLWLLAQGETLPPQVTELRCGEALLLGHDALYYQPLPGCRSDACVLRAEVLEEYTRPAPEGGARRLVLGIGRQDLASGGVKFLKPGMKEIGRSADYLVVEADADLTGVSVGKTLEMIPAYEALVAAWTSPYVELKLL